MRKLVKKYQPGGYLTPNSLTSVLPNQIPTKINTSQAGLNYISKQKSYFNKMGNLNTGFNITGQAADLLGGFIPQKEQSGLTTGLNQGYDAAANMVGAIPGVGKPLEWGMKLGGMLSDGLTALGVGTDQMTTTDKILDSKFFKWNVGLLNAVGAKKSNTIYKNNEAFEQVGSSYGGVSNTVDNALAKSGKKYGLFSRNSLSKANNQIENAKLQQNKMSNIAEENQVAQIGANNPFIAARIQNKYNGGFNNISIGKSGLKLPTEEQIQKVKNILSKKTTISFRQGGKMNVIPEGALHARLHHMDVDGITKKGIPVITKEAGGEIVQHAEIERDEIIFTKEVTEKLEELYKKGTDEAAIEAGKILAREIIENTQDNTGLMKTIS